MDRRGAKPAPPNPGTKHLGHDAVLGLAAGAVEVVVDRARIAVGESGRDEAGVGTLWPGLDAGNDALDAALALGAVE